MFLCAPFAGAQTQSTDPVAATSGPLGLINLDLQPQSLLLQQPTAGAKPEPSVYDKIWAHFTQWYKNDSNPIVQQVLFTGRYQHEFAAIDADQGDLDEWNVRRMRLGPRVTLLSSSKRA